MGFSYGSQGFILILVAVSLLALGEAKTVVVGGSQGWRYGFNYTHWTLKNGPFYIKDTLGTFILKLNIMSHFFFFIFFILCFNVLIILMCSFQVRSTKQHPCS